VEDYAIAWLDDLCTAGRTVWTRLRPPATEGSVPGGSTSLRATPLLLLPRRNLASWVRLAPSVVIDAAPSSRGERVVEHLATHGASFFDEIADGTHLLRSELEDALSELVSQGRVHCDSFAGVRALLIPASRRGLPAARRRRGVSLSGIQDAGRWALVRRAADSAQIVQIRTARPAATAAASAGAKPAAVELAARALLRRYGVICWRLLEREAVWLPPWRDLIRVYHRLEARGEIRGGRFIAGLSGEQFALPEAIASLRQVRRRPATGEWICLAATDPANLLGTVLPGARVPRVTGSRVLYRDGIPVGTLVAGRIDWLAPLSTKEETVARDRLVRGPGASREDVSARAPSAAG